MMKRLLSLLVCITIFLNFSTVALAYGNEEKYIITVDDVLHQEIKGWGVTAGMPYDWRCYGFDSQTYRDLGFNIFRYELIPECGNADGTLNTDILGKICDHIQRQINMGYERYVFSVWTPPDGMLKGNVEEFNNTYANYVANVFDYITKVRKLPVPFAFSVQNEPSYGNADWATNTYTSEDYISMFIAVNNEIDRRGYTSVRMIGPESAGLPQAERTIGKNFRYYSENPEFREAMDGLAVHAYRVGLDRNRISKQVQEQMDHFVGLVRSHDFELWQSEYCPNTNLAASLEAHDYSMFVTRLFIADMAYARYNYWFWWTTFHNQSGLMRKDIDNDSQMYYGPGGRKARLTGKGQVLSTVFKNVPQGSRMQLVKSTDPAALLKDAPFMDAVAFSTNHGTVLMYNNANNENKLYKITNLNGKNATIYTLNQGNYRGERDLEVIERRNIVNGEIDNVELPPYSINVIVCETSDNNAPHMRLSSSGDIIKDGSIVYSSSAESIVEGYVDEKSVVKVNGKEVNVRTDGTFEIALDYNKATNYVINSQDIYGNTRQMEFDLKHDPTYIKFNVDEFQKKYNRNSIDITGMCDANATVSINGIAAEINDGNFSASVPLVEGDNEIIAVATNPVGGYVEEKFNIEVSYAKPKLEVISENNITSNNTEYLAVLSSDDNIVDLTVNGDSYQSDLLYKSKFDRENYEFRLFLKEGMNTFTIEVFNEYGGSNSVEINVNYVPDSSVAIVDNGEIDIYQRNGKITIDGILNETDWNLKHRMKNDYYNVGRSLISWGALWDEDGLYVAASIENSEYNNIEPSISWCDSFELFFNPGNTKAGNYSTDDLQLFYGITNEGVKYDNSQKHGSRLDGMKWELVRGDKGNYTVEIFIPWMVIKTEPKDGAEIGFDISVNDPLLRKLENKTNSADSSPRCVTTWNGSVNNWCDTSVFGTLTIRK